MILLLHLFDHSSNAQFARLVDVRRSPAAAEILAAVGDRSAVERLCFLASPGIRKGDARR